jgi:hypothetical protein
MRTSPFGLLLLIPSLAAATGCLTVGAKGADLSGEEESQNAVDEAPLYTAGGREFWEISQCNRATTVLQDAALELELAPIVAGALASNATMSGDDAAPILSGDAGVEIGSIQSRGEGDKQILLVRGWLAGVEAPMGDDGRREPGGEDAFFTTIMQRSSYNGTSSWLIFEANNDSAPVFSGTYDESNDALRNFLKTHSTDLLTEPTRAAEFKGLASQHCELFGRGTAERATLVKAVKDGLALRDADGRPLKNADSLIGFDYAVQSVSSPEADSAHVLVRVTGNLLQIQGQAVTAPQLESLGFSTSDGASGAFEVMMMMRDMGDIDGRWLPSPVAVSLSSSTDAMCKKLEGNHTTLGYCPAGLLGLPYETDAASK